MALGASKDPTRLRLSGAYLALSQPWTPIRSRVTAPWQQHDAEMPDRDMGSTTLAVMHRNSCWGPARDVSNQPLPRRRRTASYAARSAISVASRVEALVDELVEPAKVFP